MFVCRFPKSNLGNQEKQAELTLPRRRAIGWMPSQKSLLAWCSTKIWLKPVSREIRGSGEGGRAFALCQALVGTKDARETRAGAFFFFSTQQILYKLEIPHETFLVSNTILFAVPQAFPETLPFGFVSCASEIPQRVVLLLL